MARGDTHRLIRWLWTSRRLDARLVPCTAEASLSLARRACLPPNWAAMNRQAIGDVRIRG